MNRTGPFGQFAPVYRSLGMWPRPLMGKACKEIGWTTPDPALSPEVLSSWEQDKGTYNIGLLAGSPFPDGTKLGFLDIDDDRFIRLGQALLGHPLCGRRGKKGIVIPIRYLPNFSPERKIRSPIGETGKLKDVAEYLLDGAVCAIPPSIHPETSQPYHWLGRPLHEMNFNELPLIGE